MGPVEASIRERVIEARRRLAGRVPVRVIEKLAIMAATPASRPLPPYVPPKDSVPLEIRPSPSATTEQIIAEVCEKYRVKRKDLLSPIRSQFVMPARFEAIYRIREEKALSWAQIGRIFNRDHTTILHGYRRHLEGLAQ